MSRTTKFYYWALICCCGATVCTMAFPWFSFDLSVMACYGFCVLPAIFVPMLLIAVFLVRNSFLRWEHILMELSLLFLPLCFIYYFLMWHVPNITGKINLQTSLRTALPAFWVALGLSIAMFLLYQCFWHSLKRQRKASAG
ncbi:MAG: hypothetical protein VB055_01475 [Oscillospiraceae bacterium]|nr:hypothetical protein [Oscillospiraceae bacterium]